MSMSYTLNNGDVEISFNATPYRSGRVGHIDDWLPDEPAEVEIEEVEYKTKGKAFVEGKWVKCVVAVDVSPLLSDSQFEDIETEILTTDFNEYD